MIEKGDYTRFYMHRTSHWLGMDVHDRGRYHDAKGEWRLLEPGMVLTVEPGLYIRPDEKKVPASFLGIGVRIEDDVLVTEEGHRVLTAAAPKSVEAMCAHAEKRTGPRAEEGPEERTPTKSRRKPVGTADPASGLTRGRSRGRGRRGLPRRGGRGPPCRRC